MSSEPCDHYDEQVAVTVTEIEDIPLDCQWCSGAASYQLDKANRLHTLRLCDDCADVLAIVLGGGDGD